MVFLKLQSTNGDTQLVEKISIIIIDWLVDEFKKITVLTFAMTKWHYKDLKEEAEKAKIELSIYSN